MLMNYIMPLLVCSCLFLNASEISKENYPLIQPVSVEKTPIAPNPINEPPAKEQEPAQQQSTQELDSDGDGVPDSKDKCPNTPANVKVDKDGCPLDSDGDGVPDYLDKCPNTPKGFLVDGYGCPQAMTLQVHFKSGQSNVDQELLDDVKEFAQFLQDNKGYMVVIYGYTDNQGSADFNKRLSQKRAEAVKEALSRYGVKKSRVTSVGRGEEDPIADNSTPEGRATNRRIEIELIQ